MAERLEFDSAPAAAEGGERKLEFDTPSREKELRAEYLKKQLISGEPGYTQRLKDSATLGLMRPLGGLMRGVSGVFDPTSTFGERYRAGVGAEEDYAKRAVENTPGVGGVLTDIAGGAGAVGSGRIAAAGTQLANAAATGRAINPAIAPATAQAAGRAELGKAIAQGVGTGAVEGAARNAEDVGSAVTGGVIGGAIGGGTAAAVGAASKLFPAVRGAEEEARKVNQGKSPDELRKIAKDGYQLLDNAGIAYGQPQTATLKAGIDNLKATNQYNPIAHSKISDYVDQLDKLAQQPQGAKFSELHNLRSALAKEARGQDVSTREAASKVVKEIDNLVQGSKPASNPNNEDIQNIYPLASKMWRSAALADDVNWVAGKAARKASSKAGVNPDEANRAAFRAVEEKVSRPGAYDPYTDDQRKLLSKIVQGDPRQNAYRAIGGALSSPEARLGGIGAGLGGVLLHSGFDPMTAALGSGAGLVGSAALRAAGKGFSSAAASRGAENIDQLIRSITTGSPKSPNLPPSREALAVLLAKQAAQRGGAAYGASVLGD